MTFATPGSAWFAPSTCRLPPTTTGRSRSRSSLKRQLAKSWPESIQSSDGISASSGSYASTFARPQLDADPHARQSAAATASSAQYACWAPVRPVGPAVRQRRGREYLTAYDDCAFQSRDEVFSIGPDGRPGTDDDVTPLGERFDKPFKGCYSYGYGYGRGYGRLAGRRAAAPSVVAGAVQVSGGLPGPGSLDLGAVRERSLFPETLLWQPELRTDAAGRASLTVPLADSITTWKLRASASTRQGLYGETQLDLRVFQPFFVDVEMPEALTRGDQVNLAITVHNYLARPQQVELRLEPGSGLQAVGSAEHRLAVPASSTAVYLFAVRAVRIGLHELRVQARAQHEGAWLADIVRRSIRIESEGSERRLTGAGEVSSTADALVDIPANAVPGSLRAMLTVYPGPVSEAAQGLQGLLQMPSGCFEQTSSTLYPNVLILEYLRGARRAARSANLRRIEQTALRYVRAGYQRLLNFEVKGGGFSWFGDAPANRVLTAYGLMEFRDIGRVHLVDGKLLNRTQRWLVNKQAPDGTWRPDVGPSFNHVTRPHRETLRATAYIAQALRRRRLSWQSCAAGAPLPRGAPERSQGSLYARPAGQHLRPLWQGCPAIRAALSLVGSTPSPAQRGSASLAPKPPSPMAEVCLPISRPLRWRCRPCARDGTGRASCPRWCAGCSPSATASEAGTRLRQPSRLCARFSSSRGAVPGPAARWRRSGTGGRSAELRSRAIPSSNLTSPSRRRRDHTA